MTTTSQKRALDLIDTIDFEEKFLSPAQLNHWMESIKQLHRLDKPYNKTDKKKRTLRKIPSLSEKVVEMRNANR
jgi:hypothetical protein